MTTTTTRLANRTATLTLLAFFASIVGLVTVPTALRETEDAVTRLAAAAPVSAAVGTAAWAYRARAQLRVARQRETAETSSPDASADTDRRGSRT